jgi:hypothetical protein
MNNFNDELDLESGGPLRTRKMIGGRYDYREKEKHVIDVEHTPSSRFKSFKKWRDMLVEGTIISDVYSNRNITSEKSLCHNCTIC